MGNSMKFIKKLFHPLVAFIAIQLAWVLVVFFWVYWFVVRHKEFRRIAERYRPDIVGQGFDWLVLVEGILLLVVILVGVYVIFLYWNRQARLYKQQRSFMSQVTHELKSPLASIRLHLETIRMRRPSPDKMSEFVDTMLADADRLDGLISNLLLAAKLEQGRQPHLQILDLSALLTDWLRENGATIPPGGTLETEMQEGIHIAGDAEEMAMAFRNLLENAVLYSGTTPAIRVTLQGVDNLCTLTFQDNGRGIEKKELKRVFKMFHRVRRPGDKTKGTGLGLYIVKNIINNHGGKIKVTSEGPGRGTTFIITLPIVRDRQDA